MKFLKLAIIPILYICYLTATIFHSDIGGNLLSPILTAISGIMIYHSFVRLQTNSYKRIVGLLLSMSLLTWFVADVLWAIYDFILHINPEDSIFITYLYSFTNFFIVFSLTLYCFRVFRKWNIIQIILDTLVLSFLIIGLIWIVFLDKDVRNLIELRSDGLTALCIISDFIIAMWVIICYISVRTGKIPLYINLIALAIMTYTITDLIYYYQYLYRTYNPNTILDASYVASFLILALAATVHNRRSHELSVYNIGRKGKSYLLLIVPVILIIFKGADITNLIVFVTVFLLYGVVSSYIQNNIYKEGLLRKELELNNELEQKVRERTEELEESNKILQHLNHQDYITSLYNRRYLLSFLLEETQRLSQEDTIVLLFIDINRFKMIKTMYGHPIGEKILVEMADRLKPLEQIVQKSILATYADDAYIFAIIGPYDYSHGRSFAEEVVKLCSDIYYINEFQIKITVNIGISVYPMDAITIDDLIKHADLAMSQARSLGFNKYFEFDLKLSGIFLRKSNIELMLKKANYQQEFMIYYQPQLQTQTKKIIGFEALLRWKTQENELISPVEFIPVAEETGCIIPIGDWVMQSVIRQLNYWNHYFDEKIMLGINVSLKQLSSSEFFDRLKEVIKHYKINPENIDLEIIESFQLQENPEMIKMLEDIREVGVRISVDDFGTGYSSLSYLKGLPVDRIKLARELIEYIHTDHFDYQLVKSLIELSKVRGIKVIAEGVETKEQWETLMKLECDEVQGYYFGRPAPPHEIEATFGYLLKSNKLLS